MKNNILLKQFLLLSFLCLILGSCQTREDKAALLAEKTIKNLAYYPETYEAISTEIDSIYHTVLIDHDALVAAQELRDAEDKLLSANISVDTERSNIAFWSGPYLSSYDREKLRKVKEDLEKAKQRVQKAQETIQEQTDIIIRRAEELKEPEYIGWCLTHQCRPGDKEGNKEIYSFAIIADEKLEDIYMVIRDDKSSDDIKNIKKIKEVLEEKEEVE